MDKTSVVVLMLEFIGKLGEASYNPKQISRGYITDMLERKDYMSLNRELMNTLKTKSPEHKLLAGSGIIFSASGYTAVVTLPDDCLASIHWEKDDNTFEIAYSQGRLFSKNEELYRYKVFVDDLPDTSHSPLAKHVLQTGLNVIGGSLLFAVSSAS